MKKVLFVVAIVAFSLLLLVACFAGCSDRVPPVMAHADVAINTVNGIVNPNLLPVDDFSNFTSFTFTSVQDLFSSLTSSTADGLYVDDRFTLTSPYPSTLVNNNTSTAYSCTFGAESAAPCYFYVVFTLPTITSNSTISFNLITPEQNWGCRWYDITDSSYMNVQQSLTSTGNSTMYRCYRAFSITSALSQHKLAVMFYHSSTTSFSVVGLKCEIFSANVNLANTFTGLTIPSYTYPLPLYVDEQSVYCHPNLLNGADFYELPYYGTPFLSAADEPFYYTDIPTDDFTFGGYIAQVPYKLTYVDFSTVDGNNGIVPNSKYIKYRYYYKDIYADVIDIIDMRYPLTYSLCADGFSSVVITLTDDLSNSVSETFIPDYNTANVFSLTLYSVGAPALFSYVDISLQFFAADESSPVTGSLYWSKLESGYDFTGYVPISHSSPDVSAYNHIQNYDFSYLGSSIMGDNYWFYDTGYASVTLQNDLKGWHIEFVTNPSFTLSYIFSGLDIPSGTTCTFSLYASTSSLPFDVKFYSYLEGNYTLIKSAHYTKSLGSFVRSIIVPYTEGLKVSLIFPYSGEGGSFDLDYAKFETGDTFTGFLPSTYGLLQEGIEYAVNYNNGNPVTGAYYVFTSSYYDDFTLSNGEVSPFDPSFTYYGDVPTSWSSTFGLCISSGNTSAVLKTDTYHFNQLDSPYAKYVFAFHFFSLNSVDLSFTFGTAGGTFDYSGITYVRTVDNLNGLVWFALDGLPNYVTISLVSPNASVYLTRYKTEKSPFFTGWPSDDLDYNSAVVSQYQIGYSSGYNFGYQEGSNAVNSSVYSTGYDAGFSEGFGSGKYAGIAQGYEQGISIGSSGNWRSLVSALIDVPVTTIVSFLDFEILGFNMLNILRTVILLSLFFWLLNKLTGK